MGVYDELLMPSCYDFFMRSPQLDARRSQTLAAVRGRTLEVGIGTGLNLPHYPDHVTEVTGLDPNRGMAKKLRAKTSDARIDVEHVIGPAEAMPFPDASFDTVVTTLVVCSFGDITKALLEIRRVLKPGGRYVFLEHGLSCDAGTQRWQNRLNPLQKLWGAGCRLNVPIDEVIAASGLSIGQLEKGHLEGLPKTHGYLYDGVAQRSEA